MRKVLRLTLFFTLTFAALFAAAMLAALLSSWIEAARFILPNTAPQRNISELAWNALPVTLYLSVLLALSYLSRRNIPAAQAILCLVISASALFAGSAIAISRLAPAQTVFPPASATVPATARATQHEKPGLILSRSETMWILLQESSFTLGPRVVSIPGEPLIYQEAPRGPGDTILTLPPLPFDDAPSPFIRRLSGDFALSAATLYSRLQRSYVSFGVYVVSLVLLLCSLRFVFGHSRYPKRGAPGRWPLANLFIGALIFRGIAALEPFLNAPETNALLHSFLPGKNLPRFISPDFLTPAIFCALALLFILYTALAHFVRPKRIPDE
ncbi:MAG: hypothetical protein FWD91_02435 [Treponema sp.]|nr:hypothetical protein [Treponema sp.]